MIDKTGRVLGKVSIVDIFIVLVLVGVISGAVYKFTSSRTGSPFAEGQEITIRFIAEESPDFAVNAVKVGDIAKDFEKGTTFGKVTDIKVDIPRTSGVNSQGIFVASAKPYTASGIFTVVGNGSYGSNGGVQFENVEYLIGRSLQLKLGDSIVWARVYEINKKG